MEVRNAANPKDVKLYDTQRLRDEFLITGLFTQDNVKMVYSHIDRIITAGLMPIYHELKLEGGKELASDYFLCGQQIRKDYISLYGKNLKKMKPKKQILLMPWTILCLYY